MKKILTLKLALLVISFLCSVSIFAQMSGNYTIDPSGSGSRNYTTFGAAKTALGSAGVNGPVVFYVAAKTFTEQVEFVSVSGATSTNTISFVGAGVTKSILTYSASSSTTPYTLRIASSAKFFNFRDMAFEAKATSYAFAVHIFGTTVTDISFRNCKMLCTTNSTTTVSPLPISNSATSATTGGTAARILVDSCEISGGYYCISMYGLSTSATTRHQDITISNCNINNFGQSGIYAFYNNNFQILNNTITPSTYTTSNYGIYTSASYGYNNGGTTGYKCRIIGNFISNNGYYGIYASSFTGLSTGYNEIYNNVILGDQRYTSAVYGLYMTSGSYTKVYHNTIATLTNLSNTYGSCYITSGSYLDVQNNTFISSGTTSALRIGTVPTSSTFDNNNYWVWGSGNGTLVNWGGTAYDASNFKSVGGANSYNTNQGWASLTDLKIKDGCVNGANLGITTDNLGKSRSNPPDVGAYEANSAAYDAGIVAIVSPVSPLNGSTPVIGLVKNFGSTSITDLDVSYKVGSSSAVNQSFNFSTAIGACKTDTVKFSTNVSVSSCAPFMMYTGKINTTNNDAVNSNDTASSTIANGKSGTFTIGGSGADYASITAALNDISCGGITGPVVFKLAATTFNEQIEIGDIIGLSSTNTITFIGNGTANTLLTYSGTSTNYSTLRLTGNARYLIFRDLAIEGTNTTYAWPVHVYGTSVTDIKFINCKITAPSASSTSVIAVAMNGSTTSYSTGGTASRIMFDSCDISGGWGAVVMYGLTTSNATRHSDMSITNCRITNFYQYGIYSYYHNNSQYIGNYLKASTTSASTSSYSIYTTANSGYNNGGSTGYICRINNNISENNGYYGIYLSSYAGTSTGQNEVMNNVILGDQRYTSGAYSVYMTSCSYTNFYHNTVAAYQSISSTYGALYVTSGSYLDIKNNVLIGNGLTPALRIGTNPSSSSFDYNNYYNWSNGSVLINYSSTDYDATNYQSVGGSNSFNSNQGWPSLTNLTIKDGCVNGAKLGVMTDVMGAARDSAGDIGAYEAQGGKYDLGIIKLLNPQNPATGGLNVVKAEIKNFGTIAVDTFTAGYQYAGGSIVNENFTRTTAISACTVDTLEFTTKVNLSGCNPITVFTGDVKNNTDQVHANDTLNMQIGVGKSGVYTVGGTSPDFATLQEALDALDCGGISGPTTISIRPGTYNGQVYIKPIIGTSATNMLTITSSTGNAADVIITDSTTLTDNRQVIRFNGASYVTLQNVTVYNRSKIYGWGVHLFGGTNNCRVSKCIIKVDSINSNSSNYIPVVISGSTSSYSTGGYNPNNTIDSNRLEQGYFGITMYGTTSPLYLDGMTIKGNTLLNTYYYGTYAVNVTNSSWENNIIMGRNTSFYYGMYFSSVGSYNSKASPRIIGNKVINASVYPLNVSGCSGTSSDPILLANNMFGGGHRSTMYGMYFTGVCDYWNIYYNSVNCNGGSTTGYAYYNSSSYYHDIQNNIFAVTDPNASTSSYSIYIGSNTGHNIDYNMYYNPKGTNLIYRAADYTTANAFTSSAGGANSIYMNPSYASILDLHLTDKCSPKGTYLSSVLNDFEGKTRSTSAPFIGAHELNINSLDAAAIDVIEPKNPVNTSTSYDVKVVVKNLGTTTITSLVVGYDLNGTIVTNTFTGLSLATCDTIHLVMTAPFQANFGSGLNRMRAFTGNLNGSADMDNTNDTTGIKFFCPLLTGNFTINPAVTSSSNFKSFALAVEAMNVCGLGGPVTLTVAPGTYNEQVEIKGIINGASATNTVTIDGVDPLTRIVSFDGTSTSSDAAFKLLGTKYVTIKNLGIKNMGATYAMGMRIANNGTQMSDSVTIQGCRFETPSYNGTSGSSYWIGLGITGSPYYITSLTTSELADNITVDGNTFVGGYYGYGSYGYSTYYNSNYRIINNTLNNQYYYGIYAAYYHDKITIDNNNINNLGLGVNTGGYGIYTYYGSGSTITRNRICGQNSGYGIYNYYENNSRTDNSVIANNSISIGNITTTNTTYGIYSYSPFNNTIAYNSVRISSNSSSAPGLYAYFSSTTYNNNNIVNNNLMNIGSGYAVYLNGASNTTVQTCLNSLDNNNYYSLGSYPLRFMNNIFTNTQLSIWSSSTFAGAANDLSTYMIDPDYASACMLSTLSLDLDSAAKPIAITTDINGNTRNANYPDIGAYEYDGPNYNLKVVAITAPNAPVSAGSSDVKVIFQNVGYANITSANVSYKVNFNGTPKTIAYSGNLAYGGFDSITFSGANAYVLAAGVKDSLYVYTDSPNGNADQYTKNDTLVKCVCEALSGTYTINGTGAKNFASFGDAINSLSQCGVSAAVTINVLPGTYNEQMVLNAVPGSSATNNVTIQSSTGIASDVELLWTSTGTADNTIIKFIQADNITLKNMTFNANGTYGNSIYFTGTSIDGSDNNTIEGNIFKSGTAALSTSYLDAAILSYQQYNNGNIVRNNKFYGNSAAVYVYGNTIINSFTKDWVIEGNTMDSQYYVGIYTIYTEKMKIANNTIYHNSAYTSKYGIYFQYNEGASEITGNKVLFDKSATYALYLYYHNNYGRTDTALIYNNFFSQTLGSYCNYLYYNKQVAYFNNSINTTGSVYGVYMVNNVANNDFLFFNNNISSGSYAINVSTNPPVYCDNNNLYSTGNLAYYNSAYSTLSAWKGALYTGSDGSSVSVNPLYVTLTDLHASAEELVGAAIPVGLTVDIDGDSRNASMPVIGADEYIADVQVAEVSGPAAVACNRTNETVTVKLRNVGQSVISNIDLAMQVNGGTAINETFTGKINPGDSADYTFSSKADLSTVGNNTIEVTSSRSIDYNATNDVASLTVLHAANPMVSFTHKDTCFGGTVNFTNTSSVAHGTITGSSWDFNNGNNSTATNPSQAFAGVGPYMVKLTATSSLGCVDSTTKAVNILSDLMGGTIGSTKTICYNSAASLFTNDASASGSGTNYNYQWQSSTDGTNFNDITGATGATYQAGNQTSKMWYRRMVTTDLGCGPKYSNVIEISTYTQLAAGSIGSAQTICYNTSPSAITQISSATGGDGTFTYRWESSIDNSNWFTIIGANNANYAPGNLTLSTYFRRVDIGGSGCGEVTTNTVKITVYNELTAGTFYPNYDICPNSSPGTITQTGSATGGDGNYTYQWEESSDLITWSNISGATSASYTPGVLTTNMYYRRVVTSGSGCGTLTSATIAISVRPLPTASFTTANHCIGDKVPLVNTATPGFGTLTGFFWDFGNGTTFTTNTPSYTYPTGGVKSIKLVVTNSIGCKDSITESVNVSNVPNASFTTLYDCNNDSLRFKNTTSVNCGKINAFSWDFGDGNSSTDENPIYKYANPGTYNVTFVIYLTGGITDTTVKSYTVYPKANVDFTVSDVCYNDVSQFNNTSTNASSYLWKFGDNNTSNATNPNHLYATSGTYSVTLAAVSLNGCNFTVTKSHVVKVRPDADIVSGSRCLGDSISFGNGSIYAHTYFWNFGDGSTSTLATPAKLYNAAGNYTVKLVATNNNGCVDSTTASATVYSLPVADFNVSAACFGNDITLNNTSTGGVSYAWNLGDGSSSATTNPVYRYGSAGTYNITLQTTSGFGCKNSITKSVDVYPKPKAAFTTANVCAGATASFTNNSTISSGTISYVWNFGDGGSSTSVSPTHTYTNAGVYNITLTASSGNNCTDVTTGSITIHTAAIADFSASNACLGKKVTFNNLSQNGNTYSWNFGDGGSSTAFSPDHTYNTANAFNVMLTVNNSNNCSASITKSVQVNPVPTVSFSGTNVCLGNPTTFTNSSSISSGTLTYSWDFGNGSSSTLTSPTNTYASAGSYNVILTANSNNACSSSATKTVVVYANPIADFTANNACAGTSIQFVNNSSAGTYNWNFGNGNFSTNANPVYTYATAGTYTVTLTVTNSNNCVSVISKQVTIYGAPTAAFSAVAVCEGLTTNFTNTSTGAVSYNWSFGDGGASTSANPAYIYPKAGTYNATLVATNSNGCKAQTTNSVTVYAKPVASFNTANVCLGTAMNFTNTSTGTGNSYNWLFGDGGSSTSTNTTHNYGSAADYTVTLTATNANNCTSVASKLVKVFAAPSAAFTSNDQCLGNNMVFTNQSSGAVLYNWQFGDATSSPLTNPVKGYSAAGTYNVSLTATNNNGCSNTISKNVVIYPNPTASFTSTSLCTDNTAQMNNTSSISSGTLTYDWNFSDGGANSSLTAPSHTFPASGTYVVTLTATSGFGCKSTVQNNVTVAPAPVATFNAAEVCLGATTIFDNTSANGASSVWNFGDGGNSNAMFPTHKYATAGTFNVSLTLTSNNGCISNVSKPVTVNPNPTAAFTAANACQGSLVNISNTSSGANSYEWYYGFVGPDNSTTPAITIDNPGTTTIRLVALTNKGCRSEVSHFIDVFTKPIASFTVMNTCLGDQTGFVNTSLNATSYNWQFGDGNNSGNKNPSNQYAAAGTYNVKLIANNAQCSDQITMSVVVNPLPDANFTFSTKGKEVNFTSANKTNVKSYGWNFGDGLYDDQADPMHLYNNAIVQTFNACLSVTDNAGCVAEVCKNVQIDLLGVEDISGLTNKVTVYPNPNNGNFNVFVSGSQDRAVVEVYSLVGVKVANANNFANDQYNVNASGLSEGAYMVKITLDGKSSVQRIMIAK